MAGKKRKAEDKIQEQENKKMKLPVVPKTQIKLNKEHFNIPCYDLAHFLLGKLLVRKLESNVILKGRIVETECYAGGDDKGSATYNNRRTPTTEPLYMQAGTAFVYITYGMYNCFNISGSEDGGGVLLRALEPIEGIKEMEKLRSKRLKKKSLKAQELCSGPSKLCMSMDIRKDNCNTLNLSESDVLWVETDPEFKDNFEVIKTSRIGIDRVGPEWAKKPLRFYILGNDNISIIDKKAEQRANSS